MAIAVCPSLKVVNSCARETGIAELRAIIFSLNPPMVSIPSDSGNTSSNSMSLSGLLPTRTSACNAAPSATTWSGSRSHIGLRSKNSPTMSCTSGTRVEPPTITTSSISERLTPASRNARRQASRVFETRPETSSSNCALLNDPFQSSAESLMRMSAESALLNTSFAVRAAIRMRRARPASTSAGFACWIIHSPIAWSMSSPPSDEFPPVARTSNTP